MYGSSPPPPPPPKDLNRPFQPQQMSSGLLRYRSAPSSLLGEVCEDFLPIRATSPETETETETMFARFLPPENGGGHRNDSQFPPPPPPPPPPSTAAVVAETSVGFPSPCDLIYQAQNPVQTLIRQSSSPAGLFNNVENGGYNGVMRRGVMMMSNRNRNRNSSSSSSSSNYSNGEGGGGGGGGSSSRLKSQLSFSSSRQSSLLLSQISEIHENDSPTTTTPIGGGYHHHHPMPYSWEPESNHNHNHNNNNFSSPSSGGHGHGPTHNSNLQQNLHGDLGNGLTPHQFSMPKAASTSQGQMAAIHKLLQFQDSVPCKIRAKRGCATHPRSIAERARRTRISERMRKLQELVPNMDKQTNTADMLDLAVDYIKNLQKQVKTLSDSRASCTCSSSKQNPYCELN